MNLIKFLESFTDDKLYAKGTDRRASFSQFGNLGKGLALASVPFGLSALTNKAFAADIQPTPATAAGALQLALTLEYLESTFYATAMDTAGLIPVADQAAIGLIRDHEADHVTFLTTAMEAGGIAIPAVPTFDFSGGIGLTPFNDYDQFLAVAQAFEDTGVRAYKGQAGYLMSDKTLLTAALQIHSVEARHASQIRRMRGQKGWITGNDSGGLPPQVQAVYDGEQSTALGAGQFDAAAQSQAYDEVINTQTAVNIANLFIAD